MVVAVVVPPSRGAVLNHVNGVHHAMIAEAIQPQEGEAEREGDHDTEDDDEHFKRIHCFFFFCLNVCSLAKI